MRQVPRTINEYIESTTKRSYNRRKEFLKDFLESDLDACVVDHEGYYSSAKACSGSLRDGIDRFFEGQLECHLVCGEVWLIKTIALQK